MDLRPLGRTGVGVNFVDTADVYSAGESEEPSRRDESSWSALHHRPRPAGQGSLHRLLVVLPRADRRGAVGGARAAPGALSHRAAALLAAGSRHRARRAPHRPSATAWASSPTARSPAAGCPGAGPPTARRPRPRGSGWRRFEMSLPENQRKLEAVEQLAKVADDAGLSLIELAMAFVVNHPAVSSAIIGPRTMEQLDSQLSAADVALDSALLDRIDEIVKPGVNVNPADTSHCEHVLQPALRRR